MVLYSFDFKSRLVHFVDILLFLFFKKKKKEPTVREKIWKVCQLWLHNKKDTHSGKKKKKPTVYVWDRLHTPCSAAYRRDVSFVLCFFGGGLENFGNFFLFPPRRRKKKRDLVYLYCEMKCGLVIFFFKQPLVCEQCFGLVYGFVCFFNTATSLIALLLAINYS